MTEKNNEAFSPPVTLKPEYFNQVLDAITDMILVKGKSSKIVWANKAFRDFYGMTNEQLAGIIDAPFNEPDHTAQYAKDDAYVFETGKPLSIPEEKVTRFDGYIGTFYTVKSAIKDSQGKTIMTVGVSRDITAQKQLNRRLEEARAAYFHAAKMAGLGEMAAEVAHEVNTPLTTIQVLTEILSKLIRSGSNEKELLVSALERVQKSVSQISKIVLGLKLFPKTELKDNFIKLQICRVIHDTFLFCRERFLQNGVALKVQCPETLPDVFGSPTLLSQVILALLNSAHDGIFSLPEKRISLSVDQNKSFIEVSISATKYEPEQDFLSTTKAIVEKHGGTLSITQDEKSTEILLRLPHL